VVEKALGGWQKKMTLQNKFPNFLSTSSETLHEISQNSSSKIKDLFKQ